MSQGSEPSGRHDWYVLIHQLPPTPLYLRAKVRRRLSRVGAVAIKNSVYVLPARNECLEDFQWIVQEARSGGGEASVCRAEWVAGLAMDELVARFDAQVTAAYAPLRADLERLLTQLRKPPGRASASGSATLLKLRRQVREIERTDFFGSKAGQEVRLMMNAIDRAQAGQGTRRRSGRAAVDAADLVGRVWVTRRDPHIDRLATAWLVRRFVDPVARFRFVDRAGGSVAPREVSFDMLGATFGHDATRCTFETLVARLNLHDGALRQIAEIVHDIDLKDARFGRPDAHGVQQLVQGLVDAHPESGARIEAALPIFDALHASFGGKPPLGRRRRRRS